MLDTSECTLYQTIQQIEKQQRMLMKPGITRVDDPIVSLYQPHIRPMVRGKKSAGTEFGAKLAVSVVNGYARTDVLSFDNFNESTTLIDSVESYYQR